MNEAVTEAELDALFDGATQSIFRLETLPQYQVDEEADRIAAWREGRPRPEQSIRTNEWLREIAMSTLSGVRWSRVGVVDDPVTEYQRYRMTAYSEMQIAGCPVSILRRRPEGSGFIIGDFWGFDLDDPECAAAVALNYTAAGRFVGATRVSVAAAIRDRDAVLAFAVPLNEWLTFGAVPSAR